MRDDIPALLPPRPELPPSFWETNGGWIVCGFIVLMVLCIIGAVLLRRKPVAALAPDLQARGELERLRTQPQNGQTLSAVSRNLRRYLTAAFHLPDEELTTAEFLKALATVDALGRELQSDIGEFLRRCDELKFSPATVPEKPAAAERALELVALCELRRTPRPPSATIAKSSQAG